MVTSEGLAVRFGRWLVVCLLVGCGASEGADDQSSTASASATESSDPTSPAVGSIELEIHDLSPIGDDSVVTRVWPDGDIVAEELRSQLAEENDGADVYVFECPFPEQSWLTFQEFLQGGGWQDADSTAILPPDSPSLSEEPYSRYYRSCVAQVQMRGASEAEWQRIVDEADSLGIRYEFRAPSGDCSIEDSMEGLGIGYEWTNRPDDPLTCG